jgi:hypothetical protein
MMAWELRIHDHAWMRSAVNYYEVQALDKSERLDDRESSGITLSSKGLV